MGRMYLHNNLYICELLYLLCNAGSQHQGYFMLSFEFLYAPAEHWLLCVSREMDSVLIWSRQQLNPTVFLYFFLSEDLLTKYLDGQSPISPSRLVSMPDMGAWLLSLNSFSAVEVQLCFSDYANVTSVVWNGKPVLSWQISHIYLDPVRPAFILRKKARQASYYC